MIGAAMSEELRLRDVQDAISASISRDTESVDILRARRDRELVRLVNEPSRAVRSWHATWIRSLDRMIDKAVRP